MSTQSLAATATLTHGFTLADLDRAARIAVAKATRFSAGIELREDRHDIAWDAAAELLYACGCGHGRCTRSEPLDFRDLLHAGIKAIQQDEKDQRHMHGVAEQAGMPMKPNFLKFWLPPRKSKHYNGDGFSDGLLTRLVLREALGTLSPVQWEALAAMAAMNNNARQAAQATGTPHSTFNKRIQTARKQLLELLTGEGDEAAFQAPPTATEVTCRRGHPRSQFGEVYVKTDGSQTYRCTECVRIIARRNIAKKDEDQRAATRLIDRRYRHHKRGDHSLCLPRNCDLAPETDMAASA